MGEWETYSAERKPEFTAHHHYGSHSITVSHFPKRFLIADSLLGAQRPTHGPFVRNWRTLLIFCANGKARYRLVCHVDGAFGCERIGEPEWIPGMEPSDG